MMSLVVPTYLRNYEVVLAAFGYWPNLHDATVLEFERATGSIHLTLHGFEMTPEVDERGYFKLIKHHRIGFAFRGLQEVDLEQFTSDNVLFGLEFSPVADFDSLGVFRVTLDSAMGCDRDGAFSAASGEITEVVTCGSRGMCIG